MGLPVHVQNHGRLLPRGTGGFKSYCRAILGKCCVDTYGWEERKHALSGLKTLVINLDNGPECSGRRTQFLHRMVEFAELSGLCIRLVYYPPYHSKYNSIERYWAGLEKSWNGYLLSTVDAVLNRAKNFYWKGLRTTVRLLDTIYEKWVRICGNEKTALELKLECSSTLSWWDITIQSEPVF